MSGLPDLLTGFVFSPEFRRERHSITTFSMQLESDFSLTGYNTFGIEAHAGRFGRFADERVLEALLTELGHGNEPPLILGGGSNVLFTRNPPVVLKNELGGIRLTGEDADHVYVSAGAGEPWHRFVMHCIDRGWAGVENLSLIPGSVGAAPMQNIGAYGAEIRDVFHSLEAFHLRERKVISFSGADCAFGYRESVFKRALRGQFCILRVTLRLAKAPHFNISYGAIRQELDRMGVTELTIRAVSEAVIRIRTSKLPDPAQIGNAGSFFKNPEVSAAVYEELKARFPNLVAYPVAGGHKLAAGWLIEQCGWKGYREGDAGVHAKQALVLVNYGHVQGSEIYRLSERIAASVLEKFGVVLEREVNIV